jgi:hypothetical protein
MQPAVRMVLAGGHALEERFASPKLESFSQRVSARCYLEAFQRSETQAYIQGRISACGGRGAELFPVETCQMVHKATDGVPRLINQVCDHVLLLAYAAGIRRIEPAHVEEAWADLQQLPTPWNAAAVPSGDSVIEFGGLDDMPLELPPIAGTIAVPEDTKSIEGTRPAEVPKVQSALVAEMRDDPETFSQLRHIQKLLADVQGEFQPGGAIEPEVELVFETPHPFAEEFEEEEVIADRYATVAAPAAANPLAAEPVPAITTAEREHVAAADANEAEPASESREDRQSEIIPMPHDRKVAWKDGLESEVAVAAAIMEPSPRSTRSVVPPPRQEYGRLFAKLRRGL